MNAKQLKYLSVFESMAKADVTSADTAKKYFPTLLNLDYALAQDTWEYICTTYEQKIADDGSLGVLFGKTVFNLFYDKASSKAAKTVNDVAAIRRAVYQYTEVSTDGNGFALLVDLAVSGKTTAADEIFKCLVKNDRTPFGPFMKKLLERIFIELMKKNPAKKLEMPRKLATLLLTYVGKIKTDEKPMLTQRIRETI